MVAGTVASTIDIASDGFCVDQLTRTGYGWGNSVQVGGSYLGMMCGGGVFLMLSAASELACRHADDGGADYGAVTPAVAHYGSRREQRLSRMFRR